MADVQITFSSVEQSKDQLLAAGNAMHQSMMEAAAAMQKASTELSGMLQNAAVDMYNTIKASDEQMTADLNAAAQILDEMAHLLQSADRQGAMNLSLR